MKIYYTAASAGDFAREKEVRRLEADFIRRGVSALTAKAWAEAEAVGMMIDVSTAEATG